MKKTYKIESVIHLAPNIIFVGLSIVYFHFVTNLRNYAPAFYEITQSLSNGSTFEFIVLIVIVIYLFALLLMGFNLILSILDHSVNLKSITFGLVAPVIFVLIYAIFYSSVHLFFTVFITMVQLLFVIAIITLPFTLLYNRIRDKFNQ